MSGFEAGFSGIGRDRAVNCATTTSPIFLALPFLYSSVSSPLSVVILMGPLNFFWPIYHFGGLFSANWTLQILRKEWQRRLGKNI